MKNRILTRLLSAFLAFVMVAVLIPFGSISIFAANGDRGESLSEMQFLLSTYNALPNSSGKVYELHKGILPVTIYDTNYYSDLLAACQYYSAGGTFASSTTYSGKNMLEFAASAGAKITYSKNASLGIDKLFSIGVNNKFNLSGDYSYKKATESYFFEFEVVRWEGTYVFNESHLDYLKQHLNADFEKALTGVSGVYDDPATFFEKYGTHFVGGYTMGGKAGVYTSTTSINEEHNANLSAEYSTGISGSAEESGIKLGFGSALEISGEIAGNYNIGDYRTNTTTYSYGGNGVIDTTATASNISASYTDWVNSFVTTGDGWNNSILVDDKLVMYPIWELLPEGDRRTELYNAYMKMSLEQDISFIDQYVYSMPESNLPDFSDYEIISTADELKNVRLDLSGKYVLACNIDLGEEEWLPIGTEAEPFTGVFNGNGNTISGLKVTQCTDGVAGLFGCNSGTIQDLDVSGSIDVDATDENSTNDVAYVGGIAGKNEGTITNCRNGVSVNGEMAIHIVGEAASSESAGSIVINETHIANPTVYDLRETGAQTITIDTALCVKVIGDPNVVYTNVNIVVNDKDYPAYIILENVNLAYSSIYTYGDNNDRDIYVISRGESNSIDGARDAITIHVPNSQMYIVGEAPLTITGGNGSAGTNQSRNGKAGQVAICANSIVADCAKLILGGGYGGDGYVGAKGSDQTSSPSGHGWLDYKDGDPGYAGGDGGPGGTGGTGADSVSASQVHLVRGTFEFIGGGAGDGGKGGTGGTGGKGGDTSCWGYWGGKGGTGGKGGAGGNAGVAGNADGIVADDLYVGINATLTVVLGDLGKAGAGGDGGTGGAGGKGSSDISNYDTNYGAPGDPGDPGKPGSNPNMNYATVQIYTSTKCYTLYQNNNCATWGSASIAKSDKLVSISSESEQGYVNQLIAFAGGSGYWIGLSRAGSGTSYWNWQDGRQIYVPDSVECTLSNGKYVYGNTYYVVDGAADGTIAFGNWADGEPSNVTGEIYVYVDANGEWCDTTSSIVYGYITERNTFTETPNMLDACTLFVGGISGYNSGNITACYNEATVRADASSKNGGVSAVAGGIAGLNKRAIENSYNTGMVNAIANTDAYGYFADPYAQSIAWILTSDVSATIRNSCAEYADGKMPVATSASECSVTPSDVAEFVTEGETCTAKEEAADAWLAERLSIDYAVEKVYFSGQTLDESTIGVSLNGATVDPSLYSSFSTTGVNCVVVKHNGHVRYVPVLVAAMAPAEIKVARSPKSNYYQGDAFTTDGILVELIHNNGVIHHLASADISVSNPNMALVGTQNVEVTYTYNSGVDMLSCTYPITVDSVELSSIQLAQKPDKLVYNQGDELVTTGMRVEKIYNNGVVEELALEELTLVYDFSVAGTRTVVASYQGHTASFDCTINKVDLTNTPQIVVEGKNAVAGGTVTVAVKLENNPGVVSMYLNMKYDTTKLELLSVTNGNVFSDDKKVFGQALTSPYRVTWDDSINTENTLTNGTLVSFTFRVREDADLGDTAITISYNSGDVIDANLQPVEFAVVNGAVSVIDYIPGDIDADGVVNAVDVGYIRRHFAGWEGYETINIKTADVNKDGVVNAADIGLLRRYLAGWEDVTLQ